MKIKLVLFLYFLNKKIKSCSFLNILCVHPQEKVCSRPGCVGFLWFGLVWFVFSEGSLLSYILLQEFFFIKIL